MANANRKGKDYERRIAKKINSALGTNLRRTPLSGGMELKGDILETNPDSPLYRYHLELKNHKTLAIPGWWKQATSDCPLSKIPALGFNLKGTDMICIELDTFLEILSNEKTEGSRC